jgi:hypothetical protein
MIMMVMRSPRPSLRKPAWYYIAGVIIVGRYIAEPIIVDDSFEVSHPFKVV